MNTLSFNSGSSTLKFALFETEGNDELASGMVDWSGGGETATLAFHSPATDEKRSFAKVADGGEAVAWILSSLVESGLDAPIGIVGHRVVHGGTEFSETTLVSNRVIQILKRISNLAPLHTPPALKVMAAIRRARPEAAHFAVFDTAFFANLSRSATLYPLPYAWFERYGIRRFGFHGISHAYCSTRAAEVLGRQDDPGLRLIICHLGNGCSATAVRGGQPIETTMGFTPMEGLMMGTRSGSVDPGALLHLLRRRDFNAEQLDESLNQHSGLLGVSGVSSDFREVEAAAAAGNQRAQLAIDMFANRIRAAIGALAVTLGGVDAVVFTAGIGEHSATLRSRVCDGLRCLGLRLDQQSNRDARADCDIAQRGSPGRILALRTREERMIARESQRTFKCLN